MKRNLLFAAMIALAVVGCSKNDEDKNEPSQEPTGNQLATPSNVALDPTSIEVGATDPVTLSWTGDENAASYRIYCDDEEFDTTAETSYSIDASEFEEGEYAFAVKALAGDSEDYTDSELSSTATLTVGEGSGSGTETSWGSCSPTGDGAYTDTELTLTFNSTPTLGSTGLIKIFTADSDPDTDDPIDYIDMADVAAGFSQMNSGSTTLNTAMDVLCACAGSSDRYRVVWYNAVELDGNTVTIRPHSSVLDFSTEYFVTIDSSVITAEGFEGIAEGDWSFTTKATPSSNTSISVAKSGDADFRTVQGALTFGCTAGKDTPVTINVADGTYEEQLFLRDKNNITIKGESTSGTILQYSNSNTLQNGVGQGISDGKPSIGDALSQIGGRPVILIESVDNLRFENMTLNNTWSDARAQAEVIYFNSSYRLAFVNCTLHSRQDTFETKGYNWFYNCTIEGNVDYVWGSANACLMENCTINTIYDSEYNGAYIVQARCAETDYGYVFLGCTITADSSVPDGTVYLARSAGNESYYDNVAYINCDLSGAKLASVGWYTSPASNPETATATSGWKYYAGDYSSFDTSSWGTCCYKLSASEVSEYYPDRNTILGGASSDTSWLTAE